LRAEAAHVAEAQNAHLLHEQQSELRTGHLFLADGKGDPAKLV
jgi:hypothetical protein